MDLKKLLNKEQYDAATTVDGQVLILAGAGSGKTRVLTYRIAYMLNDKGINPYNILAITFTNKAAGEMKERVKGLIGEVADNMWISTFHSTCVRILRREIDKIGYKKDFTIYDSSDQKVLVKQCMKDLNINDKDINEQEIISKISRAKDQLLSASQYKRLHEKDFRLNKVADVYVMYQKRLKENNALDFDDLISKTVELFTKNPDVLEFYQNKFKYIMVDEYQDTNRVQYELVKLLAGKYKNVCVVGDDDQCMVEGTYINTEKGQVKIEDIKEDDKVLTDVGNGCLSYRNISNISKKQYKGNVVKVKTRRGNVIEGTPSHITFAKINVEEGLFYVYLMYKEGKGYRIGQTSSLRSREGKMTSGLAVRLNGEQADKIWILKVCDSKAEASYYEEFYSVKYGLPKWVFNARGRNLSVTQKDIDKLFSELDTVNKAEVLMEREYLYKEYPHYMAGAVIRGGTARKRVNLTFFGGKKNSEGIYSHRIGLNTSGADVKEKLIKDGFSVRDGQRNTFRIETERAQYEEAENFCKSILSSLDDFELTRKAKLTENENFMFMPLGSLRKGMSIVTITDGKAVKDEVESVEVKEYDGYVYDLNIDKVRNYVAQNIVVHNCIYAWRGADIRNILDFEKDYPEAKTVKLEQNYRSKGNILDAANNVIKHNAERKNKVLRTEAESGAKINIYRAYSDNDECDFVASKIQELMSKNNLSYNDFTILYRMNAQSRNFEEKFIKRGIPYKIIGGTRFYDRKEIKDILAYLKLINNNLDAVSLRRIINVPKRSIGDATVQKVMDFANENELPLYDCLLECENIPTLTARNVKSLKGFTDLIEDFISLEDELSVSMLIEHILDKTEYLKELKNSKDPEDVSRVENIKELVSAAVDFENGPEEDKSLSSFLEKVSLVQDVDNIDGEQNVVTLMTVHSAKGLEFPVVFMVGMENGIFPGQAALNSEKEMEEARRLCYVGITRAKEILYMTSAEVRRVFGRTVAYAQSDFIAEIPSSLKEYVSGSTGGLSNRNSFYGNNSYSRNNLYARNGISGYNENNQKISYNEAEKNLDKAINNKDTSKGKLTKEEAQPGRKVRHPKFGEGTIISAVKTSDDVKLTIAFDCQGIKNLMMSFAPLELL